MSSITATNRKPAPRPAQPVARYWRGKLPKGVDAIPQDSDEEDKSDGSGPDDSRDALTLGEDGEDEDGDGENKIQSHLSVASKKHYMSVALKNVDISSEGKVMVSGREESGRTLVELEQEEEEGMDAESTDIKPPAAQQLSSEDESDESDDSNEEYTTPILQFRPVFVPKRQRGTILERERESADSEATLRRIEEQAAERKKISHDMVGDSIRRELVSKEAEQPIPDIDDTDGLDPEEEFEAWRLRELARIKRDKEEEVRMEQEREEVERRRTIPEEQRMKEDLNRAKKSREEKPQGKQKFLQKYYHKGAFHQDVDILKKHDFTQATQSTVDVSLLPKVMQKKDFGKRSQTKYTHLLDQDTTRKNGGFGGSKSAQGKGKYGQPGDNLVCFGCGGPHMRRDCPQPTARPSQHHDAYRREHVPHSPERINYRLEEDKSRGISATPEQVKHSPDYRPVGKRRRIG